MGYESVDTRLRSSMGTRNPSQYEEMLRRLREARKEAGIRQTDVAKALGVTQTFVSKVELGERRIDPTELQEFAALYGKKVTDFLP